MSLAQILFVCNRSFGSGNETFVGDDFVGDAEDRFTGLFVGDGNFTSIVNNKGSHAARDGEYLNYVHDKYFVPENLHEVSGLNGRHVIRWNKSQIFLCGAIFIARLQSPQV